MDFSIDNLEKAVTVFYRTEALQQAEAHQWLTEAQNSPHAWGFVWALLDPRRSSEVQFFAATTLHTKLMKHWNEVPVDHYELLKKRILEAIISYAMGPKIVLNRLCIALSAYIIHTVPTHWPKAFEELVSSFQPQHLPNVEPERVIWILLEILADIPEEFQSTTLASGHRSRVQAVLQDVSNDILRVVEMCLMPLPAAGFDMSNLTTYLNAARCASTWINLDGVRIDSCTSLMNLLVDLTCFVYWNRADPEGMSLEELEITEMTTEALHAIMQRPTTRKYRSHVIKHTANFLERFERVLEAERTNSDPNKDIVNNIYSLIVNMGDTYSKFFIENLKTENTEEYKISTDLLRSILQCTNLPGMYPVDESSSIMSFSFWYTLQDDVLALETVECAQLLLKIKPYYRDLVCILLRKSMFPNDMNQNWSSDDRETFRCYRQDIADTFMYCYNVLNLEMLDILSTQLNDALQKCNVNGTINGNSWSEIETCLHAFSAVAESIEWENLYLPKLMSVLKEIPYAQLHSRVLNSALDTVGSYSEWITEHPDTMASVIPLVISGLGNPEVAPSATMALKELTRYCQMYMQPYGDMILMACQSALQTGLLKLAECSRINSSIGKVLSIMPPATVMEYLNVMLAPSFEELHRLSNAEPSPSVATDLATRLKLLTALVCSLHIDTKPPEVVQQPVLVIMQNTMAIYKKIAEKYCHNHEVIEVLSPLLKYTISTLEEDSKPIINDLLQIVVSVYREAPQASVLQVATTVLIMFGKEEKFCTINQQLLREIISVTLEMCTKMNDNLAEKSDVLEAFFTMLAQISKKVPHLVVGVGVDTAALFQCATLCLSLNELPTVKSVASYLVNFISQSRETAQANVVQAYGESLVLRVLLNLGGATPRSATDVLSDIILSLNKKYCDNLARWLHTLLAQEGFPSPRITRQQKENFIKLVLREKANKRKLTENVMEFTSICRGIIKTEDLP